MASFNPSSYTAPYTGITFQVLLTDSTLTDNNCSWAVAKNNNNWFDASIKGFGVNQVIIEITANPNDTTIDRNCTLSLIRISTLDYSSISYNFEFKISHNPTNIYIPIWKDTYFESTTSPFKYSIKKGNETIYKGKAVAYPDSNKCIINLNKYINNYLNSHLPDGIKDGVYYLDSYASEFYVYEDKPIVGEVAVDRHNFYNDYSYDKEKRKSVFLNEPIKVKTLENGLKVQDVDVRQYSFINAYNNTATNTLLMLYYPNENGIIQNEMYALDTNKQFIRIDKELLSRIGVGNTYFIRKQGDNQDTLPKAIIKTCYDYCLYYCNAYGGWDSLLIKGTTTKKDNIESLYYTKNFNNNNPEFAKVKYTNVITTNYTLKTDWFNDDEQSRLHHLLESTEVYLHNLNTDELYPVNITNKQCEYKTFTNNGKRKWYNTIEVEVAQDKIRK